MIRQYYAQRCRAGDNPLRIGVIPSGAIFYIQDHGWWRDRYRGAPICRHPWNVDWRFPEWRAMRRPTQSRHRSMGGRLYGRSVRHGGRPLTS
jgi:hypothetical protein